MDVREERIKGLMKLKVLITKLQRRRLFSTSRARANLNQVDENGKNGEKGSGGTVKKGHFAVVAVKGEKPKRFTLELGYLNNPEFIKLLEQAQEEFGFEQKGVLAVPCQPEELQDILNLKRNRRAITEW
ncbi:auxin-responsive protein SAUR71 [Pistacia vera]|uniref:auxin-responsive protein SAUR71 n=1 Tax=Pistacia vera TaxID=55513 RepID=UPI001263995A|nr:auxin-responsive protein SAUR71 [Pistacia vera]